MSAIQPPAAVRDLQSVGAQLATLASGPSEVGTGQEFSQVLTAVDQLLADAASGGTAGAATGTTATTAMSDGLSTDTLLGLGGLSGWGGSGGGTGGAIAGGQDVVQDAERYVGVPYQWGGTTASSGFDCSGFVQHVFGDVGVSLPRTSQQQATVGTPVAGLAEAQPGDLLFFEPGSSGPGHVGIYVGNGMMIDAPHTGTAVRVEPAGQPCAIRRVLGSPGSSLGSSPAGAMAAGAGVPSALAPLFESAAQQYGVPASLLAAVAQNESGFDPSAVSAAGAEGLMQLMPSTAAGLGVDPMDPAQAVDGAARMLAGLIDRFGSVPLALAAYNAGPGAVERFGGVPPYPQTQAYVQNVLASAGAGS